MPMISTYAPPRCSVMPVDSVYCSLDEISYVNLKTVYSALAAANIQHATSNLPLMPCPV
jgi:hypothetical protein